MSVVEELSGNRFAPGAITDNPMSTTEEQVADVHDNEARPQQKHDGPPKLLEDMEGHRGGGVRSLAARRPSVHVDKLMGWQRLFETWR